MQGPTGTNHHHHPPPEGSAKGQTPLGIPKLGFKPMAPPKPVPNSSSQLTPGTSSGTPGCCVGHAGMLHLPGTERTKAPYSSFQEQPQPFDESDFKRGKKKGAGGGRGQSSTKFAWHVIRGGIGRAWDQVLGSKLSAFPIPGDAPSDGHSPYLSLLSFGLVSNFIFLRPTPPADAAEHQPWPPL